MPDPARLRRDPLVRQVRRTVESRGLLRPGERLVIALSGGPDSVALTYLLTALAPANGWVLTVVHIDHQARAESAADARYCRDLAHRLDVPFIVRRVEVAPEAARRGRSWEDAARQLRYQALVDCAREAIATAIVTGHQADDQAETVLLHLLRGSGLAGLAGMSWRGPVSVPDGAGIDLVRPLLDVRRAELTEFCRRWRLRPRQDATNDSPRFTRNRLRNDILPRLAGINPRAVESINRLAAAAREDRAYLEVMATTAWNTCVQESPAGLRLRRREVAGLPPALRARVLRRAAMLHEIDLTHQLVAALTACIEAPEAGSVSLPTGLSFWCAGEWCGFGPVPWRVRPPASAVLPVPGELSWGGWRLTAHLVHGAEVAGMTGPASPGTYVARINPGLASPALTVRPRRPGDRLRPSGLAGSKSLQDALVDAKVPRSERDRIPVLEVAGGIVWVPGLRVDRCFAAAPDATTWCEIEACRADVNG